MNEWINNCDKEELLKVIQAARQIHTYKYYGNSTILKKLINNEITINQVIKYIKNLSEELQLAAVTESAFTIQCIKNPTKKVQLAALKQKGWTIEYIKNPSEELQLAAVKQDGWVIRYIKKLYGFFNRN